MHPVLAQLAVGDTVLTLHAYETFLVLAACAAGILFVRGVGGLGPGRMRAAAVFLAALAIGLAGARLLDAALDPSTYAADPGRLAALEPRGFALYGGLAAGGLVVAAWSHRSGIALRRLADASVPAVAVGIVILRIGCFLNGCCHGVATDLAWGVVFPPRVGGLERDLLEGQIPLFGTVSTPGAVHPTQLYEAAAVGVLALAARLANGRGAAPGVPALLFAAGFLLFRAANQAIRPVPPDAALATPALVAAYLGAGAVAVALLALAWRSRPVATGGRTAPQIPAAASSST